jgi:hypothetical protein
MLFYESDCQGQTSGFADSVAFFPSAISPGG